VACAGAGTGFNAGAFAGGRRDTGFFAVWQAQAARIRETSTVVRT